MTMTDQPVAKVQAEPTEQSPGVASTVGGVITGLNPVDGLFLKSEHLNRMQHYTSDLVAAVGAGLGPGVVYGFTCTLLKDNEKDKDKDKVQVTGGLAFADGRPLRSAVSASVSLKGLSTAGDEFWVVEIVPAAWTFGSEPVYGGLCEDPCGHGSGIRPYAAEGIELRLRKDLLAGFSDNHRRNWLASQYFERERRNGGEVSPSPNAPWLMPVGGIVAGVGEDRQWEGATNSYEYTAVPLGVVWQDGDVWQLDVWTARRDLGDPTPAVAWQWRLGWRPRSVFMAQVLQFQAELAKVDFGRGTTLTANQLEMKACLEDAQLHIQSKPAKENIKKCLGMLGSEDGASLVTAGFEELPPAGYLPMAFPNVDEKTAREFFGGQVKVRVRPCRADYVAHAVEEAQHMDRIPLRGLIGPEPEIDLLLPQPGLVDLRATNLDIERGYGWSAFVRRRNDPVAEQSREAVEVYLWTIDHRLENAQDRASLVEELKAWLEKRAPRPEQGFDSIGSLTYPEAEWGVPADPDGVWTEIHKRLTEQVAAVGVAREENRRPLAAARAALLVAPELPTDGDPVELPPTYTLAVQGIAPELIVIIVGQGGDG
jgi:hypothetical protein